MSIETEPLPGMSNLPAPPKLWAVFVHNPQVIAVKDRADAERWAALVNEGKASPRLRAEVVEWPHSANGHANDLAFGDERWT